MLPALNDFGQEPAPSTTPSVAHMAPPVGVAIPSGDVFDLIANPGTTNYIVDRLQGVDDLIAVGSGKKITAYSTEALIHRFRSVKALTPEDDAKLSAAPIGLNQYPVLRTLRGVIKKNAEEIRSTTEDGRLLLWGTHPTPSESVFKGISALVYSKWVQLALESRPDWYQGADVRDLALEWAFACGVRKAGTQQAIRYRLLKVAPYGLSIPLDQAAVKLAVEVAQNDKILALHFFRCLQRVAAYQWRGVAMWSSAWLRGAGQSDNAIRGASGFSGSLTKLLKANVLDQIASPCPGKRPATYKLRVPLNRGIFDAKSFAHYVGVTVSDDGVPSRRQ